jgi:hypothetical protein
VPEPPDQQTDAQSQRGGDVLDLVDVGEPGIAEVALVAVYHDVQAILISLALLSSARVRG